MNPGERTRTFVDRFLRGEVTAAEIDDDIDRWHAGGSALPLHAYLGMTIEEYAAWVVDASSLEKLREVRS